MSSTGSTNNGDANNANNDPRDPSGFLQLNAAGRPSDGTPSTVVKIVGTARDDLNGLLGFCTAYNRDRERYMVRMASVDAANQPNATVMALRPANLVKASTIETYKAQFQQLRTDPMVRQRLSEYYNYATTKCRPFRVEHVAGGLSVVMGLLVYFLGVTKTLMLVSAAIMVFCILVEDVVRQRKPWREIVRNFPSRSKTIMEKQFPFARGKLSEPIAAGIVGLLLAFTVQSVFFTSNGSSNSNSNSAGTSIHGAVSGTPTSGHHRGSSVGSALHKTRLEELYHLGFQDSLDGKDRGHSLDARLEELLHGSTPQLDDHADADDLDSEIRYSASPLTAPPPSKTFASRLLSVRTAGSVFHLYRTAMQVGVDPSTGIFSVAQMAANIQHRMPVWQKGILAFSCYNLISNLFL